MSAGPWCRKAHDFMTQRKNFTKAISFLIPQYLSLRWLYMSHISKQQRKFTQAANREKKKVAAGDKGCGCWPRFHLLIPEKEKDPAENS